VNRHVLHMADIDDEGVGQILRRAREPWGAPAGATRRPILGSLFLTPSMRTRLGFEVAAGRLGGACVTITELRFDEKMSGAESFEDALRVVTGMVDVLVVRIPFALQPSVVGRHARCPVINGGDAGHHPSQALIDIAAIEQFAGRLADVRIAVCGDLRMRSVTSLLELLERRRPKELVLAHPPSRPPVVMPPWARVVEPEAIADVDVLLMPGLAPKVGGSELLGPERARYAATREMLDRLPSQAVVLSPMPVIDEITTEARLDPRVRMFEQSDNAVFVRMAILEWVLQQRASS
jgi:aspartate carbamoyltransferase catalytic subunit